MPVQLFDIMRPRITRSIIRMRCDEAQHRNKVRGSGFRGLTGPGGALSGSNHLLDFD